MNRRGILAMVVALFTTPFRKVSFKNYTGRLLSDRDMIGPALCQDCGHVHLKWITCYGAAKDRADGYFVDPKTGDGA